MSGKHDRKVNGDSSKQDTEKMTYIKRHDKYYLIGGDLFVLIGTTMFKVHSYFFRREAKNFYNKVLDPVSPGQDKQGNTEDTAIFMKNVSIEEFERFLWVFYNPLYSIYVTDISNWFSILKLAHEWDFPRVKEFALREIKRREDELPVVERIVLYQKYNAPPEYLVPLYAQLCARAMSPTEEEAAQLGFEQMFKVFKAREALRSPGGESPLPDGIQEQETYPTISAVLGLPDYKVDPSDQPSEDIPKIKEPKKDKSGKKSGTK